jgi:arylsulfatase A-like enzyme
MDAPTTDDGRGAYPGFEGRVGRVFATSEPSWPRRRTAPQGAPNVVVMVADDLGFSDLGCYGSEILTPHLDALAASGLRYTNFHVAPLCSPTRASLLTGRNAHAVGMGQVAHIDAGFPGYTGELPEHQPSMAEMFRTNGFATLAVGKWHLCKNADLSEAGDKHSWPLQRGFDQYYGFLEALTNFHHPHRMYEGNAVVDTDEYPDGYYLTDDLTERAVQMIREVKTAAPAKPFFLYYAHGAVHAPLHAKRADIEALRGLYDEGWDIIRERRLARQIELGIVPAGTELPPRNTEPDEDVVAWDSLSADERTVFARYMECYAAMVRTIDDSVGAIRAELERHGQLDNTIFIFTSDNGASREGRESGTVAYFRDSGRSAAGKTTIDEAITRLDEIGGPTTWPHYPRGWAMACNTPFRLYKISTFRGGHSVPLVVSWPDRIVPDQIVRGQYTHVTDVLPTLADLIGLDVPTTRNGLPADPLDGVTFAATLADAEATTAHTEQYYECVGHRAFHRDGWHAVTFHPTSVPFSQDQWQLFDARADVNELHDVADQHPDRVAELVDAWEEAAWRNQVFPLDEGTGLSKLLVPPFAAAADAPVRILPGTPTLERFRSSRLIARSTFGITVEWDYQRGDNGILVAHGGQEGGYVLWVEDGELGFTVNALGTPMPVGQAALGDTSRRLDVRFEIGSPRMWKVTVDLDGTPVMKRDEIPQMTSYLPYEGIDVGLDRRSPVSWDLHQRHGAFPFTGTIHAVTYAPGPATPEDDQRRLEDLRAIGTGLE